MVSGVHGVGAGPYVDGQMEADARWASGPVFLRADLDLPISPLPLDGSAPAPQLVPPEFAFVRLGRGVGPDVRAGVMVPDFGTEPTDRDIGYTATAAVGSVMTGAWVAGVEPGVWIGRTRVFAFLGHDFVWAQPTLGGGWSGALSDRVSTYSGGFYLPQDRVAMAVTANQIALDEHLGLLAEVNGGATDAQPFVGGQLGLTGRWGPVGAGLRADHVSVDRGYVEPKFGIDGAHPTALTAAVRWWSWESFGVVVEGCERFGPHTPPAFEWTVLVAARTLGEPGQTDLAR